MKPINKNQQEEKQKQKQKIRQAFINPLDTITVYITNRRDGITWRILASFYIYIWTRFLILKIYSNCDDFPRSCHNFLFPIQSERGKAKRIGWQVAHVFVLFKRRTIRCWWEGESQTFFSLVTILCISVITCSWRKLTAIVYPSVRNPIKYPVRKRKENKTRKLELEFHYFTLISYFFGDFFQQRNK